MPPSSSTVQPQQPIEPTCKIDNCQKKRKRNNSINGNERKGIYDDLKESYIHEPFRKSNKLSNVNRKLLDVQIVAPTPEGIRECTRIIRCSNPSSSKRTKLVSVPTEKCYSFFSFVPFQKPSRDPNSDINCRRKAWESLVALRPVEQNEASIYLHHPIQAYNFVAFSNRKTFLYKQGNCDTSVPTTTCDESTLAAVTFSESHEVLNRLSTAFWPGFVTIFAPVRTRRLKCSSISSNEEDTDRLRGHGSTGSLNSLASLSSEGSNLPDEYKHLLKSTPVVPDSILKSACDLQLMGVESSVKQYVGMRCPSHPISRKILLDTYGQKKEDLKNPLKGAVIGINSSSKKLQSCKDFCADLKCLDGTSIEAFGNMEKPVIYVVNGDDQREQFSVPPCEFGDVSSISLVIDTPNRTIFLVRDESKCTQVSDPFEIKVADVKRALSHINDYTSVKFRAIAAVMGKWDVKEIKRNSNAN